MQSETRQLTPGKAELGFKKPALSALGQRVSLALAMASLPLNEARLTTYTVKCLSSNLKGRLIL